MTSRRKRAPAKPPRPAVEEAPGPNGNVDDRILERITDVILRVTPDKSGQVRLPTERALAEMLGVQRATVRERLATLQSLGVIRRTQGSGTYLSLPTSSFVELYFNIALKVGYLTVDELRDAFEMVSREVAAAACLNATELDLAALRAAIAAIEGSVGPEQQVETHYAFHLTLARASHNPVLLLITEGVAVVLREILRQRIRLLRMVSGALSRDVESHRAILSAVGDREPDAARTASDEHFRLWRREAAKVSMLYLG
jgi:GntR family transcriptional regulator, transcriptional repressor for pyruvate dehydrogenase complex